MAPVNLSAQRETKQHKTANLTTGVKRPLFRISKLPQRLDRAEILAECFDSVSIVSEKKKSSTWYAQLLAGTQAHRKKLVAAVTNTVLHPSRYIQLPPMCSIKGMGDGTILPDWSVDAINPAIDDLTGLFSTAMSSVTNPYMYDETLTVHTCAQRFLTFLETVKSECNVWVYTWTREQLVTSIMARSAFRATLQKSRQELEQFQMLLRHGRTGWDLFALEGNFFGIIMPLLEAIDRLTTKAMENRCDSGNFLRDSLSLPTINVIEEVERQQRARR